MKAGVPMELMELMLEDFVKDEYTVCVPDVLTSIP
jgi:hypothetical protein